MDGRPKGIRVKIPVRKNETIENSRLLPVPGKIIPLADIKQAAVRGVFGKKIPVISEKQIDLRGVFGKKIPAISEKQVEEPVFREIEEPLGDIIQQQPEVVPAVPIAVPIAVPSTQPKVPTEQAPVTRIVRARPTIIIDKTTVMSKKKREPIKPESCKDQTTVPEYTPYETQIVNVEKDTKYKLPKTQTYQPINRYFFNRMIPTIYKDFAIQKRAPIDYNACMKMDVQTYNYQQFIREYMRLESPSRGILVYHGLGSGKTCSAIGAAEAIFSDSAYNMVGETPRKIIVLTPVSLQENFINEISFCGFKHYSVKNHWSSLALTNADDSYNMAVFCFAKSVLHIPETYLQELLKSSRPMIWVPDFSKASNFDQKSADEQDQIKKQIRETVRSRIEFIGYTGLTRAKLKEWAIIDPTHFDNAVIVIDEVHNLTRLMRGRLEKYLNKKEQKPGAKPRKETAIPISYEPVTTQRWVPKLVTEEKHYDRGFLLYRLLAEARNSKIIALSGTPIVNYPDEVAILGNILHGYFHSATITCAAIPDTRAVEELLSAHERVDFYSVKSGEKSTIFFTLLEPGFKKVGDKEGNVVYDGQIITIEDLVTQIKTQLVDIARILVKETVVEALPLFPVGKSEFESTFINKASARIQNSLVFLKRMSGLISYYKGGRKDYMPAVNRDVVVEVPMSAHMLGPYIETRAKERKLEKVKEKPADQKQVTESINWGVIAGLPSDSNKKASASYRFRSRAMCNFVFPKGIARPFPKDSSEAILSAVVGTVIYGDRSEEVGVAPDIEKIDAEIAQLDAEEAEVEAESDVEPVALPSDDSIVGQEISEEEKTRLLKMTYEDRIKYTVEKLDTERDTYFKLESADPTNRLDTYSPKFARIIENIGKAPGSSLVYSQFKTLEGIGILGIALKANGYEQVRIIMEDGIMMFDSATVASFNERPTQPRYMVFSGEEPRVVRQALINTFNMNWDAALTKELKEVLNNAPGLKATGNLKGEVCRVFMITGAGAEGLSLKNVRAVHLMEPYWNKVRMDQVKGRAVRICSHKDLPQKERNVDIFTYISTITKEQMATAQEIEFQDDGMTTDQYIYNVSIRKEKINNDFLNTIQVGAVDCLNNRIENNMYKCFEVQDTADNEFLYDPRLRDDLATSLTQFGEKNKEIKPRIVKEMPAGILEKAPVAVKTLFADRGGDGKLIYTEMISDDGAHYFGIFTDEEYTHPLPYDIDRQLGTYDSKTGKVVFKKIKPTL